MIAPKIIPMRTRMLKLLVPTRERSAKGVVPWMVWPPFMTAKRTFLGDALLTLSGHHARHNLLKVLMFRSQKLCPQTKFAAILKL
jgi:hypothetical protein